MIGLALAQLAAPFVLGANACTGYSPLLSLSARRRPARSALNSAAAWTSVTVTVPAYNEAQILRSAVGCALARDYQPDRLQVLSDAPTEDADDMVREFADRGPELVRLPRELPHLARAELPLRVRGRRGVPGAAHERPRRGGAPQDAHDGAWAGDSAPSHDLVPPRHLPLDAGEPQSLPMARRSALPLDALGAVLLSTAWPPAVVLVAAVAVGGCAGSSACIGRAGARCPGHSPSPASSLPATWLPCRRGPRTARHYQCRLVAFATRSGVDAPASASLGAPQPASAADHLASGPALAGR